MRKLLVDKWRAKELKENCYPAKPQPAPTSMTFLPWRTSNPVSTAFSKNFPKTIPLSHITDPVTPGAPYSITISEIKPQKRTFTAA